MIRIESDEEKRELAAAVGACIRNPRPAEAQRGKPGAQSIGKYKPAVDEPRRGALIKGANGGTLGNLANAMNLFRTSPEWAGVLAFNQFFLKVETVKAAPWGESIGQWADHHDCLAAEWLQHHGVQVNDAITHRAVLTVARERSFHPVRQYLERLAWDGTTRLADWLTRYLGVEPSNFSQAIGPRWMVSAVARIFEPGCKVDSMVILEGPQGTRKSQALEKLTEPWYTDQLDDLTTKDASMQTAGVWCIEWAELDTLSRAESSRAKAFITRRRDRFRPPYGRLVEEFPRQCVFAGTVNHDTYLKDETGARRFWPVRCGHIDLESLIRDRDALWAEAVLQYRAGTQWWIDEPELTKEAEREQDGRFDEDPWQPFIAKWLMDRESISSEELLTQCIGKPKEQLTQADKNRVSRVLRALRWERYRARTSRGLEWAYRPMEGWQ